MAIEQRADDIRLRADEFGPLGLQRQRERGAGHRIGGYLRLHDHWSQHLESLESGRRGLRSSQLVLMADVLVLRRFRQLHVPQRAQIVEIPERSLRVHGVRGGLRPPSRFDLSSQLGLASEVDLVGHPPERVVESDGTEFLLQAGDPARVDPRWLAAEGAHDPRLGRLVDLRRGQQCSDLPLVDLRPEARPSARGGEPLRTDGHRVDHPTSPGAGVTGKRHPAAVADEVRHIHALPRATGSRCRALKADGLDALPEVVTHRRVDHDLARWIGWVGRPMSPRRLDRLLIGESTEADEIAVVDRVAQELGHPSGGQDPTSSPRHEATLGGFEGERVVAVQPGRIQLEEQHRRGDAVRIGLEDGSRPGASTKAERGMAAWVAVCPELRGDAAGDRPRPVEVVDLGLDRLLAEVALPIGIGAQQAPIREVQDAAAGMERIPKGEGERWIAHEPTEVRDKADLDPAIGRPGEGGLQSPSIPAGRGVMEFEIRRADPRASLGQVELVCLAFGAAAVVLGLGRDPDDSK